MKDKLQEVKTWKHGTDQKTQNIDQNLKTQERFFKNCN